MFNFRKQVKETARELLPQVIKNEVQRVYRDCIKRPEFAEFRFIKNIQWDIQDVNKEISDKDAFFIAKEILKEHKELNGINFGDHGWDWSDDGARDLAYAYEIDYWDSE